MRVYQCVWTSMQWEISLLQKTFFGGWKLFLERNVTTVHKTAVPVGESRSQVSGKLKVHSESIPTTQPLTLCGVWSPRKAEFMTSKGSSPHGAACRRRWRCSAANKWEKNCRHLTPWCHRLAFPTVLAPSYFRLSQTAETSYSTLRHVGRWSQDDSVSVFFFGYQGGTFSIERLKKVPEHWPKCVDCIKGD